MFEQEISQTEAQRVLDRGESGWRAAVCVKDGCQSVCSLPGVELHIEWDNPNCAIIYHFWVSERLRGAGVGTAILHETVEQIRPIPRIKRVGTSIQASNGATAHVLSKAGFDETVTYDHDEYDDQLVDGRLEF